MVASVAECRGVAPRIQPLLALVGPGDRALPRDEAGSRARAERRDQTEAGGLTGRFVLTYTERTDAFGMVWQHS